MSNAQALATPQTLPALVRRAADTLASATTAAEVLEARDLASAAYTAAKQAARFAKAKKAHDDIVAKVHRSQADALEIEAQAKRRLADEYDAAQARGEVATVGKRSQAERLIEAPPSAADIGLSRKEIHEARQIRDAEAAEPGIVREALNTLIAEGEEPTKAALKERITHRTQFTGNNEWYTPAEYLEAARGALGDIDLDPASSSDAQLKVRARQFITEAQDGLLPEWHGRVWLNPPYAQPAIQHFVSKLIAELGAGRVTAAIMLTHNYTDTAWFHEAAAEAAAICFTRGRIKFLDPAGKPAAPTQGQAFFYFGDDAEKFSSVFSKTGLIVRCL